MEIILQSSNPVDISLDNNKSVEVTNETKAIRGPRGYSNYQIAVQNGFTGSEAEWLLSLVGPQGIPGKDGISGRGITAFTLVKTEGLKNTYQIDYSDGTKTEIVIKNGIASYDDLTDKPKINNVELNDNKTSNDLGLQELLDSGVNIKTINNKSILGGGNIDVASDMTALTNIELEEILNRNIEEA